MGQIQLSAQPNHIWWRMLGFKTLRTNVLELQFVICWQTMIKI